MAEAGHDLTALLRRVSDGDEQAKDELYRQAEGELRKRAQAFLSHERPGHLLQTTMLVDDTFLKLVHDQRISWESRSHFFCWAARTMRHLLADYADRHHAQKRGGGRAAASLHLVPEPIERQAVDLPTLLTLHEALNKLAQTHAELVQIVELKFFGGWELKQIAEVILHTSYRTIKRRWELAKALLGREMRGGKDDD